MVLGGSRRKALDSIGVLTVASADYNAWATSVRQQGGRVVVPSTDSTSVPRRLSGAFPLEVWGPRVNAKSSGGGAYWPLPDEYSMNGRTGYYHAPLALQREAASFGKATDAEGEKAGTQLMEQWGIPEWLRSPAKFVERLGSSA